MSYSLSQSEARSCKKNRFRKLKSLLELLPDHISRRFDPIEVFPGLESWLKFLKEKLKVQEEEGNREEVGSREVQEGEIGEIGEGGEGEAEGGEQLAQEREKAKLQAGVPHPGEDIIYRDWYREYIMKDDPLESNVIFSKLFQKLQVRSRSEAMAETVGSIMNIHIGRNR